MEIKGDKDKRVALVYEKAENEEEDDIILLMYLLDSNVNLNDINLESIPKFRKDSKDKMIQLAGNLLNGRIELNSRIETVADKIAELRGERPDIQKLKTSEIEKLDINESLAKIDEILGTNYVELYTEVKQNSMEWKPEQEDSIKDKGKRVYFEDAERRNELQLDSFEV